MRDIDYPAETVADGDDRQTERVKTGTGSEITVADNGCGYDPADDNEPHIALKNIRQRLEIMCGGSLTITPNDGGGTVVTVTIPNSAAEKQQRNDESITAPDKSSGK